MTAPTQRAVAVVAEQPILGWIATLAQVLVLALTANTGLAFAGAPAMDMIDGEKLVAGFPATQAATTVGGEDGEAESLQAQRALGAADDSTGVRLAIPQAHDAVTGTAIAIGGEPFDGVAGLTDRTASAFASPAQALHLTFAGTEHGRRLRHRFTTLETPDIAANSWQLGPIFPTEFVGLATLTHHLGEGLEFGELTNGLLAVEIGRMFTLPALAFVRTIPVITARLIAVHAQHAEQGRVVVILNPAIETATAALVGADGPAPFVASTGDMVEGEEDSLLLSTTGADGAVVIEDIVEDLLGFGGDYRLPLRTRLIGADVVPSGLLLGIVHSAF